MMMAADPNLVRQYNLPALLKIKETCDRLTADLRLPKRIVVRKDYWERAIEELPVIHNTDATLNSLYCLPVVIVDDPLAPDYYFDYV